MPRALARKLLALAALVLLTTHLSTAADLEAALRSISTNDLLRHTRVLASDEFEGRAPGGRGEDLTIRYLVDQFRQTGLEPGGLGGSWFQDVPLVGIRSQVAAHVARGSTREEWQFPQDYLAWSPHMVERVEVQDSELVFVGYGVVAPEFGWDDFKDVDVRGKTLVMLVNDPPIPHPDHPTDLDPNSFRGRAMTYYGRWTYKYEIAAARGARAALVVHETGPAGYPYFVVINSWGRENFDLRRADLNTNRLAVAAWMSSTRARQLFSESGLDFDAMKSAALRRDFRPRSLGASVTFAVTNTLREVSSRNVVAQLPGSHPDRRREVVVYTSHWDHLGRDDRLSGDSIFNGALDNATGSAALIELAEAFTRLPHRPERTVLFLAVTAEEQGLLGSKFYVEHPLHPLSATVANLNIDGLNVIGQCPDVGVVGHGLNTLEDLLAHAALSQHRVVRPESEPEKGGYFRSDHFEFARQGVPALYLDSSCNQVRGQPDGYGRMRRDEYRERDYHKTTDEMKSWWDLSGAVDDLRLLFQVGYELVNSNAWPEWKPGAEFKARRDAQRPSTIP